TALQAVPRIGAQKAKKILLELKPKLAKLQLTAPHAVKAGRAAEDGWLEKAGAAPGLDAAMLRDLRSALENLGYKEKEFAPVLQRFRVAPPARELSILIREALRELT